MNTTFKAFVVQETADHFVGAWQQLPIPPVGNDELLIQVEYSSLNYKDALSAAGNTGVTRSYPHVPGIDAAGTVVDSTSPDFPLNTKVIVTGYDLGMNTWGGFGQYILVPAAWAVKLPAGASAKMAMSLGTAGLTAGLSIERLVQAGLGPASGPIAVSGATGGVGSLAVSILTQLGYAVTAITGKASGSFATQVLGAQALVDRTAFVQLNDSKALAKPVFAGAVDTVGGAVLSALLKATRYGGLVTCCGMVSSSELSTSIFPFILRGISLAGIDSVQVDRAVRERLWAQLLTAWYPPNAAGLITEIGPDELPGALGQLLGGQAQGRLVLKHDSKGRP